MKKMALFLGFFLPTVASLAGPSDRAIVLSGGLDPFENRNSLYLQTRKVLENLQSRMSGTQIDLFFGAGNSPSTRNPIPDVHRFSTQSQLDLVDELFPGILPDNRSADSRTLEEYFRFELPKKMNPKGNLFLLVSDHGMPNPFLPGDEDPYSDNCIVLWTGMPGTQEQPRNPCLSVKDLKAHLDRSNAKRTVFAMTQCYSGGFHGMSVRRDERNHWTANPRVCGFTATTEDEVANGVSSDVNSPKYQGYERRLTEALTGSDMATGAPLAPPAPTLQVAHIRAAETDTNFDIPLATSEVFLRNWAHDIESSRFEPRTGRGARARRAFILAAEGNLSPEKILGASGSLRSWFESRFAHLDRMAARVGKTSEAVKRLWNQPLSVLKKEIEERSAGIDVKETELNAIQARIDRLNGEILLPAYRMHLSEKAMAPGFLSVLENMYHYQIAFSLDLYKEQIYLLSKARSPLALIFAEQMRSFGDITKHSLERIENGVYRDDVHALEDLYGQESAKQEEIWELQRERNLLRRFRIQREAIAAAYALIQIKSGRALSDLQGLLECEATGF